MSKLETLFCAVRKIPVPALPEEIVRQRLLLHMTQSLGFPSNLIVIEKELRHLPHLSLSPTKLPERRADIICFGKDIHPDFDLYPLILVECKAVSITPKAVQQITGYNYYAKSYFVSLANQKEIRTGWLSQSASNYEFVPYLPSYKELMESIKKC